MASNYVDDLIDDDEVPELTEEDFKNSLTFDQLPEAEQRVLREIMAGNVTFRPDPTREDVPLSSDVLSRFRAKGADWPQHVDAALRQWLDEHEAEYPKAS
jgi:uncharacterized protein (DUF4415 family)